MIGKKKLFSSVAGIVVVAAMAFGTSRPLPLRPRPAMRPVASRIRAARSATPASRPVLCCDPL